MKNRFADLVIGLGMLIACYGLYRLFRDDWAGFTKSCGLLSVVVGYAVARAGAVFARGGTML